MAITHSRLAITNQNKNTIHQHRNINNPTDLIKRITLIIQLIQSLNRILYLLKVESIIKLFHQICIDFKYDKVLAVYGRKLYDFKKRLVNTNLIFTNKFINFVLNIKFFALK